MRPVTLCLLLLPSFALAQPMDLFGSGPKSIAMGGVQIAADDDYTAAYYNPALLWHGSVGFGINYTAPSFNVQATAEPVGEQALLWRKPVDYTGVTSVANAVSCARMYSASDSPVSPCAWASASTFTASPCTNECNSTCSSSFSAASSCVPSSARITQFAKPMPFGDALGRLTCITRASHGCRRSTAHSRRAPRLELRARALRRRLGQRELDRAARSGPRAARQCVALTRHAPATR